ncbi:MAG: hypothetical protein ACM3XM_15625 [Mycobacterium leprae]
MTRSSRYTADSGGLRQLCSMKAPTLSVDAVRHIRAIPGGYGWTGFLGIATDRIGDLVIANKPISFAAGESGTFPGIEVVERSVYTGLFAKSLHEAESLSAVLKGLEAWNREPVVEHVSILLDYLKYYDTIRHTAEEITTDLGLLFSLSGGGHLIVLAADSEAELLEFGYASTPSQLAWWFSPEAVAQQWAIYDPEAGSEVLAMNRTRIEVT